jgi:hypothetical protein
MYDFILNMWKKGNVTATEVNGYAAYGFITTDQAATILATPQNT